jgi:Sulfotransferase domain
MIKRAKGYLETVLLRKPAGRLATVFSDDVFLVGYFRSGSTWSRFIFGNYIWQGEPITFANLDELIPSIYSLPDRILRKRHRVIKSHEYFDPRYPRVIYIVRDPRDVAVSFYFYNLKVRLLPDGYPMDDFVKRFISARVVDYADRVGTWEEHAMSWVRMRHGNKNFCLVRYEDLLADPVKELRKVSPMLRIDPTPERIERAIKLSSAKEMRSLEKSQSEKWVTTKGTRQDIPFVRDAKSGGWRDRLSEASVRMIEEAWGSTMEDLGYELAYGSEHSRLEGHLEPQG